MIKKIAVVLLVMLTFCLAEPVYDGLWFLGFNLDSDVLKVKNNRIKVAKAVDREKMCKKIVPDELAAYSVVFPMAEYQPTDDIDLKIKSEKAITKNSEIKKLVLLHSDGIKSRKTAQWIAADLKKADIKVVLKKINMSKYNTWEKALKKRKYDLFLMGFKTEYKSSVVTYLQPLFGSGGYANFMGYSNIVVDRLIKELPEAAGSTRPVILKMINKNISKDLPVLPIFYIEQI